MGGDPVDEGVQVWDLVTGQTRNLGGQGISVAMFPDGRRFATNWLSPLIHIIDVDTGDVLRELDHEHGAHDRASTRTAADWFPAGSTRCCWSGI